MRIWDYVPHPVDHPGWFFALVTAVSTTVAGLAGEETAALAILATYVTGGVVIRCMRGLHDAVNRPGLGGIFTRLWVLASVVWSGCAVAFTAGDFIVVALPWLAGVMLYRAGKFVLGFSSDDDH